MTAHPVTAIRVYPRHGSGLALYQARIDRGWTMRELAAASGVSFATITRLEHLTDFASISFGVIDRLATALGVTVQGLTEGKW